MRGADEAIYLVDPRRDTGVCGEVVAYSAIGFGLRFINTFNTYCCLNPSFTLFAYPFCFLLFSMFTAGFCKLLEYTEIDNPILKCHNRRKHQKGRW